MTVEINSNKKVVSKVINIKNNIVSGFADEVDFHGLHLVQYEKKRVSKILPVTFFKRLIFLSLRFLVHEDSQIAAWTRKWTCPWNVVIGSVTYGPFQSRSEAISFEKDIIRASNEFSQ